MRITRLALLLSVVGCVPNPYAKFYQGVPDARISPAYVSSAAPLQIYSSNDFSRDVLELMRRGYVLVGQSSFNAAMNKVKESQLRDQAGHIGAQVVLVSSRYTNTVSGAIPLAVPSSSTTKTTATVTASGSGGYATATGTGTSTTYGSQMVMMPYAVARGDFAAVYFAKSKTRLGLFVAALDDSIRVRLQSNSGVKVLVVVDGSPAFDADILPGDIIMALGGERVSSVERFGQLVETNNGRTIEVALNRSGREIEKKIKLLSIAHP